jgi:hypothetical protein
LENKRVEQVLPGSGEGGSWHKQFTHVSKYKNDKVKGERKNKLK